MSLFHCSLSVATNLIEEVSKSDLEFVLREGDKILNNGDYFHLTGLTKLHPLRPLTPGPDRRTSIASVLSQAGGRRSSVISVVSTSSENVLKMTVMTNRTRRLSVTSQVTSVNIPLVIVTSHQSDTPATAWDGGYKNFKFRCQTVVASQCSYKTNLRLKRSIREREEYLERRMSLRSKQSERGSV